jgi:hypothetical protein
MANRKASEEAALISWSSTARRSVIHSDSPSMLNANERETAEGSEKRKGRDSWPYNQNLANIHSTPLGAIYVPVIYGVIVGRPLGGVSPLSLRRPHTLHS